MKTTGILQAVILLLLLAYAASCEVGKEYSKKVFGRQPALKSENKPVRFMQSDTNAASVIKKKPKTVFKEPADTAVSETLIIEKSAEVKPSGSVRNKKVRQ